MELIRFENETAILNTLVAQKIAMFERAVADIKRQEDALKAQILQEMEDRGILKIETDELCITYVAEFDRESLDTKKLRKEHADLYDQYVRMTTVKPSIRIKVVE